MNIIKNKTFEGKYKIVDRKIMIIIENKKYNKNTMDSFIYL